MTRLWRARSERTGRVKCRGAIAIELVLVAPAVVFLLLLGVAGGRLSGAQALVDDAAVSGARAASLAPGPAEALPAALTAIDADLLTPSADCADFNPQTDVTLTYGPPPAVTFQAGGTVTVTVTCDFANSGLSLPINNSVTESSTAPIDPYRSVGT
jgi:Flp pilus assembly protein TadG